MKWTAISWGVVNECSIGVGVIAMDWRDVRMSGNSGKGVKGCKVVRAFRENKGF